MSTSGVWSRPAPSLPQAWPRPALSLTLSGVSRRDQAAGASDGHAANDQVGAQPNWQESNASPAQEHGKVRPPPRPHEQESQPQRADRQDRPESPLAQPLAPQ